MTQFAAAPAYQEPMSGQSVANGIADRLDIEGLWLLFRRRLRVFFYTAIIIFDICALAAVMLPDRYTATAVVVLGSDGSPVTPSSQRVKTEEPENNSDVETQMAIITSREIAAKVVDYLNLEDDPDMRAMLRDGGMLTRLARGLGLASAPPSGPLTAAERARLRELAIRRISANLDVERVSSAYAITIAYSDPNPIRAAAIANATARIYTDEQVRVKQADNARAVRLLGERIGALKQAAQADFNAVQNYRVANNLLSTTGATLTEQEISAYNQQVAIAKAEADADRARLSTAQNQLRRGSMGDDVGEALSSPVIQSLRIKRAELSARVANYAGSLGPRNPDFADALRQLADVDAQIQAEINRVLSNLDAKARVSQQRLASLSGSLGAAQGALAQNNRAMVALDDLQRRADASQALYESYLNRYKEAVAANGAEMADSRLVSDARIPTAPSFPKKTHFIALGLLLGIGAGFVAAIGVELAFTGLTSGEDVRRRLRVPYWGGIPDFRRLDPPVDDPLKTVAQNPRSALTQSVRGVLAKMRQSVAPHQVVMLGSAIPDEGKTTLSLCLALAAARVGERVILIDCDSTRHQLSDFVRAGEDNGPGLREVLNGDVTIAAALREDERGFHVLPIVRAFDADMPQVDVAKMQALLAQLREHFTLILFDTAPLLPVSEGRELASLADAVLLVGRWRHTPEKAMSSALDLLPPDARANTGVVLSQVNLKQLGRFTREDAGAFYRSYQEYYHA